MGSGGNGYYNRSPRQSLYVYDTRKTQCYKEGSEAVRICAGLTPLPRICPRGERLTPSQSFAPLAPG